MMARRFVLDTALLDLSGVRRTVALCMDQASGSIIANRTDADRDAALAGALTDAVIAFGVPETVYMDNGPTNARLSRLCESLGVTISRIPPYSGMAKPIERAFRDIRIDLGAGGGR